MPLEALKSFWVWPLLANSSIRRTISSLVSIALVFMQSYGLYYQGKTCTWWGGYVATDPKLGISGILESIETAIKKFVPKEWGITPHLKVSNLTREHLRKIITAFIATGSGEHAAPFYRQGTGTINILVLAMLSQIAEEKQNVIFAMEEPEIAIP